MKFRKSAPVSVHVGIACHEFVHVEFFASMQDMAAYIQQKPPPGLERFSVSTYSSSILPHSRQQIAEQAVDSGSTHLLMLDADMAFEPTLLQNLLRWRRECVAAAAIQRRPPYAINAETAPNVKLEIGESTALEKVWSVGTAVALVETAALKRMPKPWFDFEYMPEIGKFRGEDIYFCRKLREAGVELHVDPEATRGVAHVGSYAYRAHQAGGSS